MQLHQDTYRQQSDLADYCRTDILSPDLQVNRKHVHHYRRLVYNIIDDSLRSAYPLTYKLLTEDEWDMLVNYFFSTYKNQSTQIWRMPEEFFNFWKNRAHDIHQTYPFLADLLHFEWMEIEVFMMEDISYPTIQDKGDLHNDLLAFNPEHRFMHLHYPVHTESAVHLTEKDSGDYYVLIYREKDSGKVQFMDLSALFTLVLENLVQGLSLNEILEELKISFSMSNSDEVLANILPLLNTLKDRKFILGFHKP